MAWNQHFLVQVMPLHDTIPTLTNIEFNVGGSRAFYMCMCIMPGVRAGIAGSAPKLRCVGMYLRIPAIKIAVCFNQGINTAHEGMCAINYRHLLMQRLNRMVEETAGAIIQQAGNAYFGQLLARFFGVIMGKFRYLQTIPEQHLYLNSLTHGIA